VADINVERRERSVWPWIIGLIILALLIWLLWSWMGNGDTRVDPMPVDTVRADTPMVVAPAPPPMVADTPVGFGADTPMTTDTPGVGTPNL
jgi:hypothetical protein